MEDNIDRFINDHKEYFSRNKTFIESNTWNSHETYKEDIDKLADELSSIPKNLKPEAALKRKQDITSKIRDLGDKHQKSKAIMFTQETEITTSIVSRLSTFIKDTEKNGDRALTKVQKFIDFTVSIIDIHLEKCKLYLNYSPILDNESKETEEEIEYRGQEIKFQDKVFQKKSGIQDILYSLNTKFSVDGTEIKFFKDEMAPLVMREPLCLLNEDIKAKTENLQVFWNISTSKEMFINMRKCDIPKWNTKKHYFDQDPVALQFWAEEQVKIKNGINLNGFFMHGWLYFHLNFFMTPIPQEDGSEPNIQPGLRDNEHFFAENLKDAINPNYPEFYSKALLIYGTRRFGKSVILASLAHWRSITKFNSSGTIIGGTSSDLAALTSKVKTSMSFIENPLRLGIITQNWDNGETSFGIKSDSSTSIVFSTLIVQNLEAGTLKKTQKTAGLAPSVSIYDEIGKYPFLKPYLAALPSFKTPYGFKCITVLAGTGGEAELSKDAMDVLSNPEVFDLLPMNWDKLETHIDPEEITWKRRNFATFFPGQMAYEEGFIKDPVPLDKYLKIEDEELSKVIINVTRWKANREFLEAKAEKSKNAKTQKSNLLVQQQKVQYPLDPEDCFLSSEQNPFPYEEAIERKEYLYQTGKWDRRRRLGRDSNGRITVDISTAELAAFPHPGGVIDAPALIFEDMPEYPQSMYTYVAGGDFYKQEDSDTDSVGTIVIYKFPLFGDPFAYRPVASYSARPDKFGKFYDNCLTLLEGYNAVFFPENEDLSGFQTYLEKKHLEDKYLMRNIDFSGTLEMVMDSKRKWGWTPANSKKKLFSILVSFLNESVTIKNDEGEMVEVKRIQTIDDVGFLDEIINYKPTTNVDRITAHMGAVGFIHYLEKNYIYPKNTRRVEDSESTISKVKPQTFYSNPAVRRGHYRKR